LVEQKTSWWQKLKQGLKKTSDNLGGQLRHLVTARKLDKELLDELEELLIQSDMGAPAAAKFRSSLQKQRLDQDVTTDEVKQMLCDEMEAILKQAESPLTISPGKGLQVVVMVGVNGSGKTTTIAKLGKICQDNGLSFAFAACDTFRAAAVEQLKVWGSRLGVEVFAKETGANAAALAFDAVTKAKQDNLDVLFIDTAGRLHNKDDLMQELQRILRVIKKADENAPQHILLVLDATTGQNVYKQVSVFKEVAGITGLIMTKLDGTAKGGVLVGLTDKFNLPIHAIGVGESLTDMQTFKAKDFAKSLVGIDKDAD